jgi:hypothetical protein
MDDRNAYWKKMYDELEVQMKDMMHMTLDLIENNKNSEGHAHETEEIKRLKKEIHRLKLVEHKFKVTFLGRITLKYIAIKSFMKKIIKK